MADDTETQIPISESDEPDKLLYRIGVMIERQGVHVKRIPRIDRKLTEVATKQEAMGERLSGIEKNGHPCKNQYEIDGLLEAVKESETVETKTRVVGLRKDMDKTGQEIDSFRKGRINALVAAIMGFVGVIGTVGSTSWCISSSLGSVQKDIATEKAVREEQHKGVKARLDRLPTRDQVPTREQLPTRDQVRKIGTAIKNGDEFIRRCQKLTPQQKTRLVRQVRAGVLPPEFLCP